MLEHILEVKNVSKMYGAKYALRNINFNIFSGEIFGIVGPKGSGKSTLMHIIAGLVHPTEGEVNIAGVSVENNFEKAVAMLGSCLDNVNMYKYMTAKQNLTYTAKLYSNMSKQHIIDTLNVVGLQNHINESVSQFSPSMVQQLALAQALVHQPKLVILDEPLKNLNDNLISRFNQILRSLSIEKKMSFLISSNNLSDIEKLCDTVAFFDNGTILETRTMNKIKQDLNANSRYRITLNYPNYSAKTIYLKYSIPVEVAGNSLLVPYDKKMLSQIVESLRARDIQIYDIKAESKTLEDIYIDILKSRRTSN